MRGSWKAGGTAVFSTLVSVALAYQLPAVVELDLGRSFPSALAIENFHDTEQGYRWTRAESRIVFRDPGGFRDAVVELELSGFRPPAPERAQPPIVVVEVAGESVRVRPAAAASSGTRSMRAPPGGGAPMSTSIYTRKRSRRARATIARSAYASTVSG